MTGSQAQKPHVFRKSKSCYYGVAEVARRRRVGANCECGAFGGTAKPSITVLLLVVVVVVARSPRQDHFVNDRVVAKMHMGDRGCSDRF